jgi:hypothetical protein
MKKYQFSFIAVFVCSTVFCQTYLIDSNYFNNDSIKYQLIFKTRSVLYQKSDQKVGYYINLNIPDSFKKKLMKMDSTFWFKKLEDETSDWATNLVLYYLYDREAILIRTVENDRRKWMKIRKKEIDYWKIFLASH